MLLLSADECNLVRQLKKAEVFQDVEPNRIDQRNGVIAISCSDGDQFCDLLQRQIFFQADQRSKPRIHSFSWHGGALACVPNSPVNNRWYANNVFLDQIPDAREMKKIDEVVLYAHGPCGAAHKARMCLEEVISSQIQARREIILGNPGMNVSCFFHVDYGNYANYKGKKHTYFLSPRRWEAWTRKNR
jgi:hypothetical protein